MDRDNDKEEHQAHEHANDSANGVDISTDETAAIVTVSAVIFLS